MFVAVVGLLVGMSAQSPTEVRASRFSLPIQLNPAVADRIEAVEVWTSRDRGRSWARSALLPPDRTKYDTPDLRNGEYWFGLHLRMTDGSVDPPHRERPMSVVRVRVAVPTQEPGFTIWFCGITIRIVQVQPEAPRRIFWPPE